MNWPTTGKVLTVCFGPASQSIERGRISREGALDARESRERRDKTVPNFSPEKQETRNFGLIFSTFLSRIACCSRESTSAWQNENFRQKQPNNKKEKNMGLRFFFQKWACASRFQWGIFIFLAAEKLTFGGVQLQNWLASDHPWAAYTSMSHPFFGGKDVCYCYMYWKQGGQIKSFSKAASLYLACSRLEKTFFCAHLFFSITDVFCAKKRLGHACICPRMYSG